MVNNRRFLVGFTHSKGWGNMDILNSSGELLAMEYLTTVLPNQLREHFKMPADEPICIIAISEIKA